MTLTEGPIEILADYRHKIWRDHCNYVLQKLLIPYFQKENDLSRNTCLYKAVIIENRIDSQWLFTVLNTYLMCPKGTLIYIISDSKGIIKGKNLLERNSFNINIEWVSVNKIDETVDLSIKKKF